MFFGVIQNSTPHGTPAKKKYTNLRSSNNKCVYNTISGFNVILLITIEAERLLKPFRMNLLFFLRRDRVNSQGTPVYFRITINGERLIPARFTGLRIDANKFKNQRVKGNDAANLILDTIAYKLKAVHASQVASGQTPTVNSVISVYEGKNKIGLYTLAQAYFTYCETYLIGNKKLDKEEAITQSTLNTYRYKFKHIIRYYKSHGHNDDGEPSANSITGFELQKIVDWLRIEGGIDLQRSSVARVVTVLKKIIAFGYKKGFLPYNLIKDFTYNRGADAQPVNLSLLDVQKMWVYPFDRELQPIADLFLLQCYTGFYLADIYNFSVDNVKNIKGRDFIIYQRAKNGSIASVPLNEVVQTLIDKYNFRWPAISADRYNQLLKRVGDRLGYDIKLTMKTGRKTFANLMKNHEGFNTTALAAMMGHSKEDTQKHYARPNIESVLKEIANKGF